MRTPRRAFGLSVEVRLSYVWWCVGHLDTGDGAVGGVDGAKTCQSQLESGGRGDAGSTGRSWSAIRQYPTSCHAPSLYPTARNVPAGSKPTASCRRTLAGFGSAMPANAFTKPCRVRQPIRLRYSWRVPRPAVVQTRRHRPTSRLTTGRPAAHDAERHTRIRLRRYRVRPRSRGGRATSARCGRA